MTFSERLKEHLMAHSPVFYHANSSGHQISVDTFCIVDREVIEDIPL